MSNTRHVERSLTQKHKQKPPSHKDFVLVSRLGDETYKWARPAQLSRIMMRAVSLNGNCLQYASAGLKDDKEIVLRAVLVWRLEDVPPAVAFGEVVKPWLPNKRSLPRSSFWLPVAEHRMELHAGQERW